MDKLSPLSLKIKEAIQSLQNQPEDQAKVDNSALNIHKAKVKTDTVKQYTGERRLYAKLIYRFIYLWCVAVAILLLGCGIGKIRLSDMVLTTIIVSTTLNVFGFFYLVTRYLFSRINRTDN